MRFYCELFLVLLVLTFVGAGCQKSDTSEVKVVFTKSPDGDIYFQPEGKTGYEKVVPDSLGNLAVVLSLQEPTYYQYVTTKQQFYSVYLMPGTRVEIVEDEHGVSFKGDLVAENTFLAENPFIGIRKEGVSSYSEEWLEINRDGLKEVIAKLERSGLPAEFIHLQTLKYKYGFYNQLLNGPGTMVMFMNMNVELPADFYDFLKELKFDDPMITRVPKWFQTLLAAFERMEKEDMIEVSPDRFMEIYAQRIENEKVRSLFLVNLLSLTLDKGYSDSFPDYVIGIRRLITDSSAITQLSAIEARYQSARDVNSTILRGMPAPKFKAVDVKGKEYTSADFAGKIQVLDFWFTGCIPCRAEMPYMAKLADEMEGQPIVFLSISLDTGDELLGLWKQMVQDKKGAEYYLNVPGGFKSELTKAYLIRGVPRMVIIDKEGNIVDAYAKRPSDPKLKIQLEQLMKE